MTRTPPTGLGTGSVRTQSKGSIWNDINIEGQIDELGIKKLTSFDQMKALIRSRTSSVMTSRRHVSFLTAIRLWKGSRITSVHSLWRREAGKTSSPRECLEWLVKYHESWLVVSVQELNVDNVVHPVRRDHGGQVKRVGREHGTRRRRTTRNCKGGDQQN